MNHGLLLKLSALGCLCMWPMFMWLKVPRVALSGQRILSCHTDRGTAAWPRLLKDAHSSCPSSHSMVERRPKTDVKINGEI